MNSKQVNNYYKNGFLIVKNVFTKNECNKFKNILKNEIVKGNKDYKTYKNRVIKETSYNKNRLGDVPRKIKSGFLQDIAHRNSKIMKIAKNKKLVSIVHKIFGGKIKRYRLYRSLSIFKTKNIRSRTPWHQDMPYWKGNSKKCSVWISLDKVTKKSGSMCYIPGSHKRIYPHVKTKSYLVVKSVDESKKASVETNIGDVLIHHSMIIHGSEENTLKKNRYALIFTYQPAIDKSHHRVGKAELIEQKTR